MKKAKNTLLTIVKKLHLYVGLVIGLIVFIVAITGCLYAFQKEIDDFLRKDIIYHHEPNPEQKQVLSLAKLEAQVKTVSQEPYELFWVEIPLQKEKSYIFTYLEMDENAWNYFDEFICYKTVYVNPYTGQVLRIIDEKYHFFHLVKYLHFSLLLQSSWGKYVTGIPTLLFIGMLLSGLYLWWPRNKKARTQRFSFQWENVKSWKRKNYDLHNIVGFYTIPLALVLAITGAFYSFLFIQALLFTTFAQKGETYPDYTAYIREIDTSQVYNMAVLDQMSNQVAQKYPDASSYFIVYPYEHQEHTHPEHPYDVYVKQLEDAYYVSHMMIFDPNTGELLKEVNYAEKTLAQRVIEANYDIHIGAIGGIVGKIIAFTISALCASLPVTGFLIWWGRRRKSVIRTPSLITSQV